MIMETENKGIDYGSGTTNVDNETGIRFGVIPQNEVLQAWADSSEAYYPCENCDLNNEDKDAFGCDGCEPSSWFVDDKEYTAECSDCVDIFVSKSPYYTRAQFCSPCAPGACYLLNPCEEGEKAYCFGHDWFEDSKAPYPVYRVADDSLVVS
jgi:hypothetical protein